MCGIVGIIGQPGEMIDPSIIDRMCQTIVHRGPDDQGVRVRGNVGLGMRRLSIIDVAGGRQPIHNEDGSVWVVFNGEIYNFAVLREELEHRGHHFYTHHSDTEVIVHLYEEMGAEFVRKLRGMFAIAIYDERRRKLLLVRDRLGKKPLYYAFSNGRLLFGSEVKAILAAAPDLKNVSPEGLLQYFYFGYIPDPFTAFTGISKLPAGHVLESAGNHVDIRQYWDFPAYGTRAPQSEQECLDELEQRVTEAVRLRLVSDVPLGGLLSGGVDSSLVVALMAKASSRPVKTFTIGFRAQNFDESTYARLVSEHFGTEHHELIVEPQIEETLDSLSRNLEEPFGDSSMIPTYHVCRIAHQHVTVALSGDGGDELFAGYERYQVMMNRQNTDLPRWMGRFYRDHLHHRMPSGLYGKNLVWNRSLPSGERYIDYMSIFPALHRESGLFAAEFIHLAESLPDPLQQFRRFHKDAPARDALSRILYLDSKTYLTGDILTKVDRMSMANSLEVRVPMLDHEFVEWVSALPIEWKLRKGAQKYILKKLAERVGVPPRVLHRPKQGFAMPLVDWIKNDLKESFLSVLLEPRTLQRGYFRPGAVRTLLSEHLRGRRNRSGLLWRMLVLELWHRNFLEAKTDSIVNELPAAYAAKSFDSTGEHRMASRRA
ncbi:MAG TPA: asparagine synthase (glutamine-hydrolyzing) [Terriglobales bacterium]